jgi:hypothetical protein
MRCHEREEPYSDEDLIWNMKEAIRLRLRRCAVSNTDEFKLFTVMKEYLIRVDYEKRLIADKRADKRAIKKAQAFASQYAKAKAQAEANRRFGKTGVVILGRATATDHSDIDDSGRDPWTWSDSESCLSEDELFE